jgi:hypothetical protein
MNCGGWPRSSTATRHGLPSTEVHDLYLPRSEAERQLRPPGPSEARGWARFVAGRWPIVDQGIELGDGVRISAVSIDYFAIGAISTSSACRPIHRYTELHRHYTVDQLVSIPTKKCVVRSHAQLSARVWLYRSGHRAQSRSAQSSTRGEAPAAEY